MSQFTIGLTGGIGSGKTTVANLFAEQGIELIDADIIAREVVRPGQPALAKISDFFTTEVLTPTGELDRKQLRNIVFQSPEKRVWLNKLLHPIISTEMQSQAKQAKSLYVIMVVPLLFENGLDSLVNRTLLVDISPDAQMTRAANRDHVSAEQIKNIINSQMSRKDKLQKADDIIDNQGEISQLRSQVLKLHHKYMALAQKNTESIS
ncbi:dephospho-CoA kinase [Shewanella sp. NFH-SH190041]|uniref:dephospho-CoA kinase n=1 Tax=Shewanella sp. NFH-SH190041 TaxID=2950245 RepID=UPI0021C3CE68|nr:dephospho-CoA kinase [Shewanella sp. NFH-SH190041]BDM65905.1 dephospho-CoA kinase [Shewanella sp. NFH-SH190041]